jgi:hypothetical protein
VSATEALFSLWNWSRFEQENAPQDLLLEILPTGLPAAFVILIYLIALWKGWRKSKYGAVPGQSANLGKKRIARGLGMVIWIAIVIGLYALVDFGHSVTWHPSQAQLIMVRLAPWGVVIAMTFALGILQRRWAPRQQWFAQPSWRRPKTIEMDGNGFQLSDPLMRTSLAWACFTRARETQNLLILTTQDGLNYLIPKRAFADPLDVDHCRALLQNVIPQTSFLVLPGGFAVLPKPVIPLAEIISEQNSTGPA